MKGTTFAAYIRKQTKTNSTTLSDADLVILANVVKDDLAASIVANVDEHYFEMELYRNLEALVRDYTFPNDVLKHISFCEAKLDGTNWQVLTEADLSQFDDTPITENSYIKTKYAALDPQFLISGRSLQILSGDDIADVTDGLKLLAEIYPEDLTTSDLASSNDLSIPSADDTHRLPRPIHKVWAELVIVAHKEGRDKPVPLTKSQLKLQMDAQNGTLEVFNQLEPRNQNRSFQASVPQDDGQDY